MLLGVVTALVALAVAQVAAALISSQVGAPVNAVGELSIDHTPAPVKNFAIDAFGSSDKTVLVWGIRGVLIIFAAVIGILAIRRLRYGMAGLAVFVVGQLTAAAAKAVRSGDGHVLETSHVIFPNGAVTLVLILAESHLSIHTWPEEDLIAIDLFSCGAIDGEVVVADLVRSLELEHVIVRAVQRGIAAQPPGSGQ